MISVFISVLNMSLIASFAALGVMLIRIPLKKAPKIYSYALWAIVLFKLIIPFSIESNFSLIPVKAQPVPQNIIYNQTPSIESGIQFVDNSINQFLETAIPTPSPGLNANSPINPDPSAKDNSPEKSNSLQGTLYILSFIWLIGMAVLLLYAFISYFNLKHRLRVAIPLRKNIYETDRIKTAFVLDFVHPKIYLPLGLSERELDYILKHEEIHIKRKDHFIKLIAFIALCIHWFNPIVWLSYVLAMRDMELSCDESVLKTYGNDIRRDYSNSLLELSIKQSGFISPLSFGESGVKSRIKNVMNYKKPALWVSVAAIAVVITAAVFLLPNAVHENEQNAAGQSAETLSKNDNAAQNESPVELTVDGKLREDMFDFAIKYRFDYVPFFSEGNPPKNSADYLMYAFIINVDNWDKDKGIMPKEHVEDVISKYFGVKDIVHESLWKTWNYDGEKYTALGWEYNFEPIYVLSSLKTRTKNGKTIYDAEMYDCIPANNPFPTEEELAQIKDGIIKGDYSLLRFEQKETFSYYLNDAGEPVFIAHIMTDRPQLKWYYEMFKNNPGFMVLGSDSGEIDDRQMAAYAVLRMENYDYENGNSKEEYNAITQRYFGKNIKNFNNGATEIIPDTGRVRATGWSYDSSIFVIAKDIINNWDGTFTGNFYCVNIPDSYWTGGEEQFKQAEEEALLKGDISSFVEANCPITLKRVVYEVKHEGEKTYFKFHSVKNLEDNIKSIILYSQ